MDLAGDASRYLFPSPSVRGTAITGHALSVAMHRFGKAVSAGSEAGRSWASEQPSPHDLRRTVATRLSALGIPAEDVSAVLNHTRHDITGRHYDLYDRAKEKRCALDLWSDALTRLVENPAPPELDFGHSGGVAESVGPGPREDATGFGAVAAA